MRLLIALMLCAATVALGISKGGKLYIKTKDTPLQKQPSDKGPTVMKLGLGTQVIWNGASVKDSGWHEVSVNGQKGFVRREDLTPQAPQVEIEASTGKGINAQDFASSGAAVTRGCFGEARVRSFSSETEKASAAELIYLEELNHVKVTPAALSEKNKELHLTQR